MTLSDQVAQAANLVGLLLALVTLFTSEQARRLGDERARVGGARTSALRTIRLACVGLGAVSVASLVFLFPLVSDVVGTIGDDDWQSVYGVFLLVYVLLGALLCWQVALGFRATAASRAG